MSKSPTFLLPHNVVLASLCCHSSLRWSLLLLLSPLPPAVTRNVIFACCNSASRRHPLPLLFCQLPSTTSPPPIDSTSKCSFYRCCILSFLILSLHAFSSPPPLDDISCFSSTNRYHLLPLLSPSPPAAAPHLVASYRHFSSSSYHILLLLPPVDTTCYYCPFTL